MLFARGRSASAVTVNLLHPIASIHEDHDHRLSVQDPLTSAQVRQMLLSRTSGSRTDMSTDDETRSSSNAFLEKDYHALHQRNGGHRGKRPSRRRRRSEDRASSKRSEKSLTISSLASKEPTRSSNATALGNREIVRSHSAHSAERQGKVNRNINRFSNFVKSGMEAYLLGETKMSQSPSERHEIVSLNGVIQWKPIQKHYNCLVDKPKKESKLKGLKSFIAYSLVSSLTNIQVSRRYKHFDWLHEQLSAKYLLIPIPPLPEKQVAGRYEEDLIDHRKHILQLWVNKICRHPVLSQSEVWLHFISCTDEREWKNGKRRAEKDEYVGGNFMNCLTIPPPVLEISVVERQVEKFQRSVKTSEDAMRTMQERMVVFQKAFSGPVKQNWQKMGVAFKTLQQSFETDDTPSSRRLTEAFANTAAEYHEIGNLFDAHTRNDMEPVVESLFSYKGTVQNVPDILHLHRQTLQKFRDSEGRLTQAEAEKMRQRVNVANYAMLAEMNHQTSEKVDELKETMGKFLRKQADFYQEVSNKLRSLASRYD
ncbi:unnamed protein product [Caenorhabditis auriculariae]|uniref:Sorting nexin n=1 Tax=Caenorhabditis auriculariae TaxID=2777116 RepID=A0A8S1HFV2_9PELO|nr:unnamed protein product [Caenorhabditis auriculariae]